MIKQQNFTIIVLALFISTWVTAQQKSQEANDLYESIPAEVEDQVFRVDFINLGFQYEKGLTKEATIQAAIYLFSGFSISDTVRTLAYDVGIAPTVEVSYRYYYNLHKRKSKFKNFTNNSGQYVAPKISFTYLASPTTNVEKYNSLFAGGVWGFQKNGDPITFNFEIGLGYGVRNTELKDPTFEIINSGNLAGLGKLTVGFLIGKRNRDYKKYKQDSF